jgi:hypothetical protein
LQLVARWTLTAPTVSGSISDVTDSIVVGKLDAARRQLETAIRLYFDYGEPVSIHTLCAAGYNIVRDVKRATSPDGPVETWMLKDMGQLLDTDEAREFLRHINHAENFFKHADRDPTAVCTFSPQQTEVLLLDAVRTFIALTGDRPPLFDLYSVWFIAQNPHVFMKQPEFAKVLGVTDLSAMGEDRRAFFRNCSSPIS